MLVKATRNVLINSTHREAGEIFDLDTATAEKMINIKRVVVADAEIKPAKAKKGKDEI